MINELAAHAAIQQHEQDLTQRLERRRIAAERAVEQHGGERLALIAHLARAARAARQSGQRTSRAAGC